MGETQHEDQQTVTDRTWARASPIAVLACLAALAGCAAPVAGEPRPAAPPAAATEGYSAPRDQLDEATRLGLVVESHRLAGSTAVLAPILPEHPRACLPYGGYTDPARLQDTFGVVGSALATHGFVAGWVSCRAASPEIGTLVVTMAFADPAGAVAARDDVHAQMTSGGRTPQTLPGGEPATVQYAGDGTVSINAVAAEGHLVTLVSYNAAEGAGPDGVQAVLDAQRPLSAAYVPTPFEQLATLEYDPAGLRERTLDPTDGGLAGNDLSGPYDLSAYLHLAVDPVRERDALVTSEFEGAFVTQGEVGPLTYEVITMRFPDSRRTNAAYEVFAELADGTAPDRRPFRVPSIPAAPCFVQGDLNPTGTFDQTCYVGFGSHLAAVSVFGLPAADDTAEMDRLLVAQRDLISTP